MLMGMEELLYLKVKNISLLNTVGNFAMEKQGTKKYKTELLLNFQM